MCEKIDDKITRRRFFEPLIDDESDANANARPRVILRPGGGGGGGGERFAVPGSVSAPAV